MAVNRQRTRDNRRARRRGVLPLALAAIGVAVSTPAAARTAVTVGATRSIASTGALLESPEEAFARAGELLGKGQEKYDTADYVGAVELWSEAYAALPDTPEAAQYRSVLVYQLASACREAYELDRDQKYLKKAERLLEQYIESLGPDEEESRTTAQEALDEVRLKIKEEEAQAAARRSVIEADAKDARSGAPTSDEEEAPGKQLLIAGGVSLGVGAVLLAVMGVGLAQGSSADRDGNEFIDNGGDPADPMVGELIDKGTRANTMALATGITGGVLALTGVALIAADAVRRKKAREQASARVLPAVSPSFAGLSIRGRF